MALSSGEELSYQNIANDLSVTANTVKNYVEILEDTLIGFQIKAFLKTTKRKAITRPKFFYFDIGVTNFLAKRKDIQKGSAEFGKVFEQFIILEIRAYLHYSSQEFSLAYWRSTSGFEVDLIVNDRIAIEIKSSNNVHDGHLKGLRALKEENLCEEYLVVSCDQHVRQTADEIKILPWEHFLKSLWTDKIILPFPKVHVWDKT